MPAAENQCEVNGVHLRLIQCAELGISSYGCWPSYLNAEFAGLPHRNVASLGHSRNYSAARLHDVFVAFS